jgi:uncharacterized protein (TIGR02001 family)
MSTGSARKGCAGAFIAPRLHGIRSKRHDRRSGKFRVRTLWAIRTIPESPCESGHCSPARRSLAALAALVLATPAMPEAHASGWSGMLGFGSDNVYRGSSLTDGRPAWLADLHYGIGNEWVVGLGATAERPPWQSAGAQFTAYIDRRWRLDQDWVAKVGVIHYESPWNDRSDLLRYNELNAAIGYRGRWRMTIALSPDTAGIHGRGQVSRGFAASAEMTFHQPIVGRLAADIGVGYASLERISNRNYSYGNAGLSYGIGDVYFYTAFLWTNRSFNSYAAMTDPGSRWVTSVIWSF